MSATTSGLVFDRINSLVALQGFQRSLDAFNFDRQPEQTLDRCYFVEMDRGSTSGYFGGDQAELHSTSIWLARRVKSDQHGAARQLRADLDLLEAALYADFAAYSYSISDDPGVETSIPDPGPDATHVVARLTATVDIDREL